MARDVNPIPEKRMIVCLPIWPGDRAIAVQLLMLWTDLEPAFNPNIAIAIVVRADMEIERDIPKSIIDYVSKRFKVYTHKTRSPLVGWPQGCNGLELGAIEWFVESNRNGTYRYDYMLIAESDTVPLRKGWADEIRNEAYDTQAFLLGSYLRRPDCYCEHINGNCVIHRDFWKQCRNLFVCPPNIGWDAYIGPTAIAMGTPSRLIWQDYRLGAPDNAWKGDDYIFQTKFYKSDKTPLYGKPIYPALLHGVKGDYGIKAVRKKLLTS